MLYKKHFRDTQTQVEDRADRNLKKRFFRNLNVWRGQSKLDALLVQQVKSNKAKMYLKAWHQEYSEAVEEQTERTLAR